MTNSSNTARLALVTHEASRTGAPRVAIEVLRSPILRDVQRIAVLRMRGPLEREFRENSDSCHVAPLHRLTAAAGRIATSSVRRTLTRAIDEVSATLLWTRIRPSVVYLNSLAAIGYLRPALALGRPVVVHVHETEPTISELLGRRRAVLHSDHVHLIACSERVREAVASATGIRRDAVHLVPSLVDREVVLTRSLEAVPPLRRQPDELLVGGCGTGDYRKGIDRFVQVAHQVIDSRPDLDVRFVWIGSVDHRLWRQATAELPQRVAGRISSTGLLDNPYPALRELDVFVLTSRADPFPLVVLESMHLARAVVAFNVGDVAKQLDGSGVLVKPDDVREMSREVVALLRNPERRRSLGLAADAAAARYSMERFHAALDAVLRPLLAQLRVPGPGC